jgi:GT2 family glycosyltransferase
MAVDVVVVNYHTELLLTDFVDSYDEFKFDGCTLTVIDVEGTEAEPPVPRNRMDHYQAFRMNVGYGAACNVGALKGTNDVILLANADTLLTSGFQQCYNELVEHKDWAVLGPRQVDGENRITAGGIFGSNRAPQQRGWNQNDVGQFSDIRPDAVTVSGALYFIKRAVWRELTDCEEFQKAQPDSRGAFLETPHYFEETFCSLHARAHGYNITYYGPVVMPHFWHKASAHGGWADRQFNVSQQMHREACALHGIPCE